MPADRNILNQALGEALSGRGAHVETDTVFDALDWRLAGSRPENVPHSIYQLLNHMLYWQGWVVKWLDEANPPIPEHALGGWPGAAAPTSNKEWNRAVQRFRRELGVLSRWSRKADLDAPTEGKSRLEMLHTIASHNSYHAGQVVVLRQVLGAWPPPSGGLTW